MFVALGIGMALPYVLLALFPGWRRRLPRPGPWLVHFKQLLAFPLYATVIWLAWVLGAQRDNDAVRAPAARAARASGSRLWAWRIVRTGGARPWGIAGIAAVAGAVTIAWPLFQPRPKRRASAPRQPSKSAADPAWQPFTPARSPSSRRRAGPFSSISPRRGA